jgi:hypothetical protein
MAIKVTMAPGSDYYIEREQHKFLIHNELRFHHAQLKNKCQNCTPLKFKCLRHPFPKMFMDIFFHSI